VNTIRSAARRRAVLAGVCSSVLVVCLSISTPAPAAATCASPPAVMPAAQIAPGMVGTGLTTVQGSSPTSFDIEVIGTLQDAILPGHDLVMFQITGPQSFLDQAHGLFFGMSGSPISINGMLAGAASYRFYFSDADIGLFTPAEEMLNLVDGPAMPTSVALSSEARRLVAEAAGVPTSAAPGAAQILRTPLAVSGLATAEMDRLQATLDEHGLPVDVFPAGAPSAGLDPTPLTPGSPMGAAISIGDVSFVGIGTTTFVCGSNVNVGWGHPFFFEGPSSMALTDADVITILNDPSGIYGPSMIANPGDIHGTVVDDRFTGITGQAGPPPDPMLISSHFSNADSGVARDGQTDVYYQEDYWAPQLAWYHNYVNLLVVFDRSGSGSLDMGYTISGLREDGVTPFTVTNSVLSSSTYDAFEGIYKLSSAMYQLAFNRFEDVTFTSVETDGSVTAERLEGKISRVRTSSRIQPSLRSRGMQRVAPRGTVKVEVSLEPFGGGPSVPVTFTMRAPAQPGYYGVRLRGGRDRFFVNERHLRSLDELLDALSGGEHGNDLIATGLGRRVTTTADLMVTGKRFFTVQVVR
jgi:SpoIVB peptidase S55